MDFKLIDVCDQHQDYDPIGVSCFELLAEGESGPQMQCTDGVGNSCPAQCL